MDDIFHKLSVSAEDLAAFCRRHSIRRLAFFGSVLRDNFGPDSDVDVLYEFEAGRNPGWHMSLVVDELSALLGRPVDFIPLKGLRNPFTRHEIMGTCRYVYAA